jgi:hypothetical protein
MASVAVVRLPLAVRVELCEDVPFDDADAATVRLGVVLAAVPALTLTLYAVG